MDVTTTGRVDVARRRTSARKAVTATAAVVAVVVATVAIAPRQAGHMDDSFPSSLDETREARWIGSLAAEDAEVTSAARRHGERP